jgi:hypothetical protein
MVNEPAIWGGAVAATRMSVVWTKHTTTLSQIISNVISSQSTKKSQRPGTIQRRSRDHDALTAPKQPIPLAKLLRSPNHKS